MAGELDRHAEELAEEWLAGLRDAHGPLRLELHEDIAQIIHGLSAFMQLPGDLTRAIVVDRLRRHSDRRQAQGYTIQHLLTDFELLSQIVFRAFIRAVEGYPTPDGSAVAVLAGKLREALAEISSEAVGVYREVEREQKRVLAAKLADFAGTIAHELKNPLGAAQSGTQMLQDPTLVKSDADRDRFIELVLRNLMRTHDLIRDIRALALADAADDEERWTTLRQVVERVVGEVRAAAAKKGVHVELEGPVPEATVDGTRLEIALMNLVGNAVKYADPAKSDRYVRIRAQANGADNGTRKGDHNGGAPHLTIEVSDNGLGIPRSAYAKVFKRHFRAHPKVAEGTGLGLAITGQIVAGAGGTISFESDEGKGTTFSVVIPERRASPDRPAPRVRTAARG